MVPWGVTCPLMHLLPILKSNVKIPAFQIVKESTFSLFGSVLLVQRLAVKELFLSEVGIYLCHLSALIVV